VRFSPALKLLLAVFLPLTLFWKLTVKADNADRPEDDVIAFLARRGFHEIGTEGPNFRGIQAVNGACRMRVLMPSYYGADRDMIHSLVSADDTLIFVHRGNVYQEQPILLTVSAELWTRALRKMGFADHRTPVLAVIAPRRCDADRLPWEELQQGPQ
jgi:hypothetical protein